MNPTSEVKKFIEKQNKLSTLKFITCGSVDDGKSTLLGRLLYEAKLIFDDQIDSLVNDSKKVGTQGGEIDFALLVDGLAAEREQGITIDVAYRFFTTEKRKFIVADSPGHEQYTRNMVTAASSAELAIILIDARKGVLEQTKRHSFIANMVGIKNIIVAVNKMDLINFSQKDFISIIKSYEEIAKPLNFKHIEYVPISALDGDNIINKSSRMSWYDGSSIISLLENAKIKRDKKNAFSLPIQYVLRPNLDFRGFCGKVSSGKLNTGESIKVCGSGESAKIVDIFLGNKAVKTCEEDDSVTLTLDREIDISRGDVLLSSRDNFEKSNLFNANIIWFDSSIAMMNRNYFLKIGTKTVNAKIINLKHKIDINTYKKISCKNLEMNEIAECEILLDDSIALSSYTDNNVLGSFIIIDRTSNLTVGAGVVNHNLRRSQNVVWETTDINFQARANMLGQTPKVLWFTGLSGSGKSTISNNVEKKLFAGGNLTYILDGDNLRHGLNRDLGFNESDRIENLRRAGEVAKILYDSGLIVLASFISPFASDREIVRNLFKKGSFIEIYVKCDLDTVIERDPKNLYQKAMKGEIPNFTGIGSPYEEPENPEIIIDTTHTSPETATEKILKYLEDN